MFVCIRVLGWTAMWPVATGFEVTDSSPTIAFGTDTTILVREALVRHGLQKRGSRNS
jgi:hypothetical protein